MFEAICAFFQPAFATINQLSPITAMIIGAVGTGIIATHVFTRQLYALRGIKTKTNFLLIERPEVSLSAMANAPTGVPYVTRCLGTMDYLGQILHMYERCYPTVGGNIHVEGRVDEKWVKEFNPSGDEIVKAMFGQYDELHSEGRLLGTKVAREVKVSEAFLARRLGEIVSTTSPELAKLCRTKGLSGFDIPTAWRRANKATFVA